MIVTKNDKGAFAMRIIGNDGSDLTREYCVIAYNTLTKDALIQPLYRLHHNPIVLGTIRKYYKIVNWPGSKLVIS